MSESLNSEDESKRYGNEPLKVTHYQTNKVPWFIHAMWATFAVSGIAYLLYLAFPDFIRWW